MDATVPLHTNYCAMHALLTHIHKKNSNFLVPWEFAAAFSKVLEGLCLGPYIQHPTLFHALFPLYRLQA